MTVIDEARDRLRSRRTVQEAQPWQFPGIHDFLHYRRVLVFDATLTHIGWVLMEALPAGIRPIDKGIINLETDAAGYLGTWDKARQLRRALNSPAFGSCADGADAIVVEAPSVGGGHRTESSLIAGLTIMLQWESRERDFCSVSATHVSAVLLGDARVRSAERKKLIRAAVIRLYPPARDRDWNEHIRDAFATGAVYLYDEKQKEAA
jgi:hypothetical protein